MRKFTFAFNNRPELFQSSDDGGCTEAIIEDADVKRLRELALPRPLRPRLLHLPKRSSAQRASLAPPSLPRQRPPSASAAPTNHSIQSVFPHGRPKPSPSPSHPGRVCGGN